MKIKITPQTKIILTNRETGEQFYHLVGWGNTGHGGGYIGGLPMGEKRKYGSTLSDSNLIPLDPDNYDMEIEIQVPEQSEFQVDIEGFNPEQKEIAQADIRLTIQQLEQTAELLPAALREKFNRALALFAEVSEELEEIEPEVNNE